MLSRSHLVSMVLGAAMLVGLILVAAGPAAAQRGPGLYLPAGDRAADNLAYLYMHETTSLEADGDGEEKVEFLVSNTGSGTISASGIIFRVDTTQYWGIKAWDDNGDLQHTVSIEGDEIHVTIYFRRSLPAGEPYRYYFAINFPDLAEESSGQWRFAWRTIFPVAEFVRTVNLPEGAEVTYATPEPTEKTDNYVRWKRNNINEFTFDMRYVLRELSDQELVEQFAPYFRLHPDDVYVPMNIELALQHGRCYPKEGSNWSVCTLSLLGGAWLNQKDSYVDFSGWPGSGLTENNSSQQYYVANIRDQANKAPIVYARIYDVTNSDRKVIQYWLFYYYNSWGHQGGARGALHEGDWEMVQVVLDGTNQPLYAAYAQHGEILGGWVYKGGSKKEWNDLEKKDSNHPVVYPARGSHASYFRSGRYLANLDVTADESRDFLSPQPAVKLLVSESANPWVNYLGLWGQPSKSGFEGGPTSPGKKGIKWDNPYAWSENELGWDEKAKHHEGKARAYIDSPCNIGLQNELTGQFFGWKFNVYYSEIDGGEYIVNETTGTHSLILHNSYKQPAESFTFFTTCREGVTPSAREADAPVTLTVELYDAGADELVTAEFELPTNWSTDQSVASLEFEEGQMPVLELDRDNNGSIDEIVPPESVVSAPIEEPSLTPGGRILVPLITR